MSTRVERYQEQLAVLERRQRGDSLADIAAALDVSPRTVQRRLSAALQALGSETSDEIRRTAERRLEGVLRRAEELLAELPPRDQLRALNLIRQASRDVATLNGVQIPPAVVLRLEGVTL